MPDELTECIARFASLTVDDVELESKREFARLVARLMIATRDLMNAHFLAEQVNREDGQLHELRYHEDAQGFYNAVIQYPHYDVDDGTKHAAFIQVNYERDFRGSDEHELDELTEALHASFSTIGLCHLADAVAAYWKRKIEEGRELLRPAKAPLTTFLEAIESIPLNPCKPPTS